jgi:2-phosphosulfolactate phosphatase
MSNIVDVCLSPDLIHLFSLKNKVVVVVDIFRATSVICTALNNGITEVIPISDLGQLNEFDSNNFLIAAERDGKIVEGFKFGNSPLHYHENPDVIGKKLVFTTTNGTRAINLSKNEAESVIIASFLNITAVSSFLKRQQKDILVLCSGWKGKISLEDTLFAGFILEKLVKLGFKSESDSSFLSRQLYNDSRANLIKFALQSSHKKRTENLGMDKDLKFCLQLDVFDNVPVYNDGVIVLV